MNYISQEFQIQYLFYYKLYILAGHRDDIVMVKDDQDRVQVLIRYPCHEPTAEVTKLLALPFREVRIILPHYGLTFVPSVVYQQDELDLYSGYLVNRNDLPVEALDLQGFDVTALFQYDSFLWKKWNSLFPDAYFTPQFIPLFNQINAEVSALISRLLIHIDGSKATILLVIDGAFKFYNIFHVEAWEDLLYYILKVGDNFDLVKVDEILVSGIPSEHAYVEKLKCFGNNVSVWESDIDINGVEVDRFSNLNLILNNIPCVS